MTLGRARRATRRASWILASIGRGCQGRRRDSRPHRTPSHALQLGSACLAHAPVLIWPAMSGTSPTEDLAQRADHETGHLLVAKALGLQFYLHWITVEPRRNIGGSVALGFWEAPSAEEHAQYLLGGLVAQAVGAIYRQRVEWVRGGNPPEDPAWFHSRSKQILDEAVLGGHLDIRVIKSLPGNEDLDLKNLAKRTTDLVLANWDDIWILSDKLQEHTTLFGTEYYAELEASKENLWVSMALSAYRKNRRKVEAPPEWLAGSDSEHPAGTFCESFRTWWERDPFSSEKKENFEEWWTRRASEDANSA